MSNDEKNEKVPANERYTIFSALLEAMNEKQQKKSKWARFLKCVGIRK